jgi:hypothetical protein
VVISYFENTTYDILSAVRINRTWLENASPLHHLLTVIGILTGKLYPVGTIGTEGDLIG